MSFVANLQRNPGAFLFSGGSRGGPTAPPRPLPLYLDQTEDRRSQKKFWRLPQYLFIYLFIYLFASILIAIM